MVEEPCDLERGEELDPIGRAHRFRAIDESSEIWLLPRSDERAARRLLELGAARVGGFLRGGIDGGALWLVRRHSGSSRADRAARPWREVIGILHALAGALSACETRALFPGPLRWSGLAIDPPGIAAEPLVRAIVGAGASATAMGSDPSLKWTPPEQVAGAPWDGAANRYVLGLVAYRLLSGRHPFEGAGLRHAAQAQATSEPPPFEEEIARALQPGVQSFVLRLLSPDRAARPPTAAAIVAQCDELLATPKSVTGRRASEPSEKEAPLRSAPRQMARVRKTSWSEQARLHRASLAPLAVGVVAAFLAFAARAEDEPPRPTVAPVTPITDASSAACGKCHARELAEWSRSAMAYSAKSPLYGGLESLVEEQFGKSQTCPNGAGVLRAAGNDACVDPQSRERLTGAGGEEWCVNCHSPGSNLTEKKRQTANKEPWRAFGAPESRAPVKELLDDVGNDGVSCIGCHAAIHGAGATQTSARSPYAGNGTWTSPFSGQLFSSRPEEAAGRFGIANSAYFLDARAFFRDLLPKKPNAGDPLVHHASTKAARDYRASSEFCGACHDVRLFGTDVIGGREKGEHFKRLRNAYSEWRSWATDEERAGRTAATCQGCHMSLYPGACEPNGRDHVAAAARDADCPTGTHFVSHRAGEMAQAAKEPIFSHYFTSVDFPLAPEFAEAFIDDPALDGSGVPLGMRARQRLLLKASFAFSIGEATRSGRNLEIPIRVENVGAGHRVPAGFSQEREIWVELQVKDARGGVVYEVGHVESAKEDLRDKVFARVNTSDAVRDFQGRPLGVFGADVVDGPDVPAWSPNPNQGGTTFAGHGLINFQNGFLRCVRCIGAIDASGKCQAIGDQAQTRAGRFDDGAYDVDTGTCTSNLSDGNELFETYFPVGALDAERGVLKAPDAIIDTRSAPPNVPLTYRYQIDAASHPAPYDVHATLHFRAFPPYLIRAFADYERDQSAQGRRRNGPQVSTSMLGRLEVIDLAEAHTRIE